MKINRTSNAMGKMTMDENSINLAKAIISDIIDEVAITKGAMILDGYDEEDSCIHYMNGLVKELSDFNKKINTIYLNSKLKEISLKGENNE